MTTGTVLHIILSKEFAGTERHVAELSCALRERGWRAIIAARRDAAPEALDAYRLAADGVRELPSRYTATLVPGLAAMMRSERADVVHGHLGDATAAAVGAAQITGMPAVTTIHFVEPRHTLHRGAAVKRLMYRFMLRRTAAIIAVSDAVRQTALTARGSSGPPVRVVHNGIGCLHPEGDSGPAAGERRERAVLYAGRLSAEKQVPVLIDAVARVRPPAELWIAGRGSDEPRLRELAHRSLPGRVQFLGFVDDVASLMRRASVLAIPSRAEPFGLVALEAMQASTPVVGFASGALPEIVEDGVTGFLTAPDDTGALADALARLLDDPRATAELGAAGRRRFEERFTAAQMARATEAVYREAISRGSR